MLIDSAVPMPRRLPAHVLSLAPCRWLARGAERGALGLAFFAGVPLWLAGCAARETAMVPPPTGGASLQGWQAETFALPPAFAPTLPTGKESLRFAPGWRDPKADGFWSYAFVLWIDEPVADAARIDALLEAYYQGLMGAFAGDKGRDLSETPARVEVTPAARSDGVGDTSLTGGLDGPVRRYEARMHLIDAFATFEPIDLRLRIETSAVGAATSTVRVRVSPKLPDHAVWSSLDAAIADILRVHAEAAATAPAK